jgi:Uncharacterized protein conserved in bacteria (DUF2255)
LAVIESFRVFTKLYSGNQMQRHEINKPLAIKIESENTTRDSCLDFQKNLDLEYTPGVKLLFKGAHMKIADVSERFGSSASVTTSSSVPLTGALMTDFAVFRYVKQDSYVCAGVDKDVAFLEETDRDINDRFDAAYSTKYRRYSASITNHIVSPEVGSATIKLVPVPTNL